MSINSISAAASSYSTANVNPLVKVKQDFKDLGSALEAGNLDDAQKAFAQLKADAPAQAGKDDNNPISAEMDKLGQALASGDMQGAEGAYAKIQETLAQRPHGGGHHGGGGAGGAQGAGGAGGGSQATTTYDVKDLNQDGKVTAAEEFQYDLEHPQEAAQQAATSPSSSNAANNSSGSSINIEA